MTATSAPWVLILAGGDGLRLRSLTRIIAGDERPKQFCQLLGDRSLLDQARNRARLLARPDQTMIVLTRTHERFYGPLVGEVPERCLVIQAGNRGTAPAVLYGLFRIAAVAPMAMVVVLPSDHHVSDESAFARHIDRACAAVTGRRDLVTLLGVPALSAEPDYGWIEPGEPLPGTPLRRVARFWEKPTPALAETLLARGCLWNTLVTVACVPTLLAMARGVLPALYRAFDDIATSVGTPTERAVLEDLYRTLTPTGFSETVLAARPANLAVLPAGGVEWTDLGRPDRVIAALVRQGAYPGSPEPRDLGLSIGARS